MEDRNWWDRLRLCDGITKSGERCNRARMRPYEVRPGDLFIPSMCALHINQEPPNKACSRRGTRRGAKVVKSKSKVMVRRTRG